MESPPPSFLDSAQDSGLIAEELPSYDDLDQFTGTASGASDTSEAAPENKNENSGGMSKEDAFTFAAGGVSYLETLSSAYVGADIVIPDSQKEDIASKATAVIQKHFGNAELPPWLEKFKEEIALGVSLGTFAFSVYRQKKAFDKEQEIKNNQELEAKTPSQDYATGASDGD
ncbi:hypothetical protein [Colwellia sp. E2M01]|uniref:hypothetical protein n=1 Tax=Colwellia sp. E2M01 TaxID=2841561 RepID=UPI001C0942BA|nr:hypothetical protein [Colwellia sp. E2M01]MBU2871976.1 hypothetical protein [Colwellia sp. E2M01]